MFVPDHYFGTLSDVLLDYRVDDASPIRTVAVGNNAIAVVQPGSKAIPALRTFFGAARLYVEATAGNGIAKAEFDITGLSEAITPIREKCGW